MHRSACRFGLISSVLLPLYSGGAMAQNSGVPVRPDGSVPVYDSNSASFGDMVPVNSGTAFTPAGRAFGFNCTTSGTFTVVMATNGRSVTFPFISAAALQTLPLSVTQITVTTGACSNLWNLP